MESFHNQKDEELVAQANNGLQGQGAVVEMMRRLKETVGALDKTSAEQQAKMLSLTRWITFLTWVMVAVGIIQIVIAVAQVRMANSRSDTHSLGNLGQVIESGLTQTSK